jgi:TRAP-type C4-dicarboxylate transport system permease small subunit
VLHLATVALTTASASTDDMGRAGRQIAARCGNTGSAATPYPGSFYSVPLILLLVVIALATAAALTAVVRRPRGFAPDDVGDDVLRQRSATRVLGAAGAAVAASHVGIAFFAGTALLRMDCQRAWMDPVGWVLVATMAAALLLLGWFLGRIVVPGALPAASPTHPAETR